MKKVAIIGAGPAGVCCAYHLAKYGNYKVSLYEKAVAAGGKCNGIHVAGRTYYQNLYVAFNAHVYTRTYKYADMFDVSMQHYKLNDTVKVLSKGKIRSHLSYTHWVLDVFLYKTSRFLYLAIKSYNYFSGKLSFPLSPKWLVRKLPQILGFLLRFVVRKEYLSEVIALLSKEMREKLNFSHTAFLHTLINEKASWHHLLCTESAEAFINRFFTRRMAQYIAKHYIYLVAPGYLSPEKLPFYVQVRWMSKTLWVSNLYLAKNNTMNTILFRMLSEVAENVDEFYNADIEITRHSSGCTVLDKTSNSREEFDKLIIATSPANLKGFKRSEKEAIFDDIEHSQYCTTICKMKSELFSGTHTSLFLSDNYSKNSIHLITKTEYEKYYAFFHYDSEKAEKLVREALLTIGGLEQLEEIVGTHIAYDYFPHFKNAHNIKKLRELQGENNTYYASTLLTMENYEGALTVAEEIIEKYFSSDWECFLENQQQESNISCPVRMKNISGVKEWKVYNDPEGVEKLFSDKNIERKANLSWYWQPDEYFHDKLSLYLNDEQHLKIRKMLSEYLSSIEKNVINDFANTLSSYVDSWSRMRDFSFRIEAFLLASEVFSKSLLGQYNVTIQQDIFSIIRGHFLINIENEEMRLYSQEEAKKSHLRLVEILKQKGHHSELAHHIVGLYAIAAVVGIGTALTNIMAELSCRKPCNIEHFIYEVLRLHPSVVLYPVNLKEQQEKVSLCAVIANLNRSSKIADCPHGFIEERHASDKAQFFTFGAGDRSCLGEKLTITICKIFCEKIAPYSFELCNSPPTWGTSLASVNIPNEEDGLSIRNFARSNEQKK